MGNALWYSPVTAEVDDRNAKLLKTLSEASDTLSKADEIQVEYTEQIRVARERASKAAIMTQIESAEAAREAKESQVKAKLLEDVKAKKASAEPEIESRKEAFVKETLASVGLA